MGIGNLFNGKNNNNSKPSNKPSKPVISSNDESSIDPIEDSYNHGEMTKEQYDYARKTEEHMNKFVAKLVSSINRRYGASVSSDESPKFSENVEIEKIVTEVVALTMLEITIMTLMNKTK